MRTPTRTFWVPLVLAALGAGFGFSDLAVSQHLADPDARWAQWVQHFGEIPGLAIIAVAVCAAFLATVNLARAVWMGALATLVGTFVIVYGLRQAVGLQLQPYWIAFALCVVLVSAFKLAPPLRLTPRQRGTLRLTLWLAGAYGLVTVQSLKLLWGRVRFRDLPPDLSTYTAWYEPQGPTGHSSFPSGHAALTWMLLPCLLLIRERRNRAFALAAISAWAIYVSAARIVMGAHYVSDVLFSSALAFAFFLWGLRIVGVSEDDNAEDNEESD